MAKKKLFIFIPSIEGGGVEKNLKYISNYLVKKIGKFSIITTNKYDRIYFNKKIDFVTPKKRFWSKSSRFIKTIICLYILFLEYKKNKNIFIFSFQSNVYCIFLAKILGLKIISRANSSSLIWSKNIIKKTFFKIAFKIADKIIVNSKDLKLEFDSKFNINTTLIFNPLDKKKIFYLSKIKNKKIFFKKNYLNLINVGRLTDQKDHLTLLKAIKLVYKKIPLKLLIIGRGVNLNKIKTFIRRNQLQKIIAITNFKKNPFSYIKQSDALVLSSIYEGLPNVLLEALALKKFIISSKCPTGPREILSNGKYGFLFEPGNSEQLKNLLIKFYYNRKKIKKKTMEGYKSLKRFDFKKNLEKYLKLIKKYQ